MSSTAGTCPKPSRAPARDLQPAPHPPRANPTDRARPETRTKRKSDRPPRLPRVGAALVPAFFGQRAPRRRPRATGFRGAGRRGPAGASAARGQDVTRDPTCRAGGAQAGGLRVGAQHFGGRAWTEVPSPWPCASGEGGGGGHVKGSEDRGTAGMSAGRSLLERGRMHGWRVWQGRMARTGNARVPAAQEGMSWEAVKSALSRSKQDSYRHEVIHPEESGPSHARPRRTQNTIRCCRRHLTRPVHLRRPPALPEPPPTHLPQFGVDDRRCTPTIRPARRSNPEPARGRRRPTCAVAGRRGPSEIRSPTF